MSPSQKELYEILIDEFKMEFKDYTPRQKLSLRRLKHIMKLLKICSNPQLLADDDLVPDDFRKIFQHECNKINKVCQMAREHYIKGEKVLIWSTFRKNIDILNINSIKT